LLGLVLLGLVLTPKGKRLSTRVLPPSSLIVQLGKAWMLDSVVRHPDADLECHG
jgi:hypothetical protein